MHQLMACTHGTFDPASRFRVVQFIPRLEQAGWRVSLRPNRPSRPWRQLNNPWLRALRDRTAGTVQRLSRARDVRAAAGFDVVLVNRDLLGINLAFEKRLLARNPRVIFDFDDAIFLGEKAAHVEWMCRHAAWVTAGNDHLAAFARRFTDRVTVLPTVVDVSRYLAAAREADPQPLRVGWCGSDLSIRQTLYPYLDMLGRLQAQLGFAFVIMSKPKPVLPRCGQRWRFVRWSQRAERHLAAHMDVGLMPLVDDEFQRGKCGAKILLYMAAGIPAVASPIGVNTRIIRHGQNGYLACSEAEWGMAIDTLLRSPERRAAIGEAGRASCTREYSLERWFPMLLHLLDSVAAGRRPRVEAFAEARAR